MNKKPSFIYQSNVLIKRYLKIFVNDKKNLILKVAIPLMTIIIVCLVACGDMYSIKPEEEHEINEGFPVLMWETVVQEKKSEDKGEDNELIEAEKATVSKWDGESVSAPASPTKIDGENYFIITDAEQLAFLSKAIKNGYEDYLTYNYCLQCDIDLKNYEFTPIGDSDHPFTGTFEGNGHIIKNLTINGETKNTGLFGCIKSDAGKKTKTEVTNPALGTTLDMTFYHNGIVRNFGLKKVTVKSDYDNTGAVVGSASGTSRIYSVYVKGGSVTGSKNNTGGIIGSAVGKNVEVYCCYSTAKVSSSGKNTGGLTGQLNSSRLSASYALCDVKYTGDDESECFGAVVGQSDSAEKNIKNAFYSSDKNKNFKAVNDEDIKNAASGLSDEKLANYASFMISFKDIMSEYDKKHLSEEDEDRYDQEDYDPETDDSVDDFYGFKKDGQVAVFGATQTGLFMLVCVAIFVGICNSIQEICKERSILKREYMTNLRLSSYVTSKLVVQALVCAIQMFVVMLIFIAFVKAKQVPESGIFFGSMWIEYYITMFLLAFAADTMSLFISSIVKTSELANTFIPIILIVQIVFSGVLFEMKGFMKVLANIMISKWGINALAAVSSLNDSQPTFLIENPSLQLQLGSSLATIKEEFVSTSGNLLKVWAILIGFIVIFSVACGISLTRVKNDRR